jgi:hypothetical protein
MEDKQVGTLESSNDAILPYPHTCNECEDRGEMLVWSNSGQTYDFLVPDRARFWNPETTEYEFRNIGWPKRCKSCNARAQVFKRAKASVKRLEELRNAVQGVFKALNKYEERWTYLKFVTLTWKNELTDSPLPDMKAARRWLQRKRDKIIKKLDCVAGTDVMECITTEKDGKFHHHVHMHGIWIMPYHDIKYVGEIMKRYVGRDQCRAIKPIWIENDNHPDGGYMMSAFAQARNYLIKYLSKQAGTRRSLWGFARKGLNEETFYGRVFEIFSKWETGSESVALFPTDGSVAPVERASATT